MDYYETSSYPSAIVALVKMDELDALADAVRSLIAENPSFGINIADIQYLERMSEHVYYDLEDYCSRIAPGTEASERFETQLARTVVFTDHTQCLYSAYGFGQHWIEIGTCCGLSSYIPVSGGSFNAAYAGTAWAEAIGFSAE